MKKTMAEQEHDTRMKRAHLALDGLSVGDAFGERFFVRDPMPRIEGRAMPGAPWHTTDDTAMACSIVEVLAHAERIDQDMLAQRFAERFTRDPNRGYGGGAYRLLSEIAQGAPGARPRRPFSAAAPSATAARCASRRSVPISRTTSSAS